MTPDQLRRAQLEILESMPLAERAEAIAFIEQAASERIVRGVGNDHATEIVVALSTLEQRVKARMSAHQLSNGQTPQTPR